MTNLVLEVIFLTVVLAFSTSRTMCVCVRVCMRVHMYTYVGGVHTCSWHVFCELLCKCVSGCVHGHMAMRVCAWLCRHVWRAGRQYSIGRLVSTWLVCV